MSDAIQEAIVPGAGQETVRSQQPINGALCRVRRLSIARRRNLACENGNSPSGTSSSPLSAMIAVGSQRFLDRKPCLDLETGVERGVRREINLQESRKSEARQGPDGNY